MAADASDYTFSTGDVYTSAQLVDFHNAGFKNYVVEFVMTMERFELVMDAALGHARHLSLYMHEITTETFVGFARTAIRGRRAWCGGLAIVPSFRGKKISSLLITKYLKLLRDKSKIDVLQLECINVNTPALKLYQSAGFKVNFKLQDYSIDSTSSIYALPEELSITESHNLDLPLPWLQYRTTYSWQREFGTILALDISQFSLLDRTGRLLVAVAAEDRDDHVRILAIAYEEKLQGDHLELVVRAAIQAKGKSSGRIVLEPDYSEVIPILDGVAQRDEEFEESHMVLNFKRQS